MPTLRIHFTSDDIARVRVTPEPDPLWETVLSLHALRTNVRVLADWRRAARSRLQPSVRLLYPLAPPAKYFADFLTPAEGEHGLEPGIEAVMRTSRSRLRTELGLLSTCTRLPPWTRALAVGGAEGANAMTRVGSALQAYYDAAIAPYLPVIGMVVGADRALRARAVLDGGSEALLDGFRPLMRWCPPVLEVAYPASRDLHLKGRGLRLVPSFFCWRYPVTLFDPVLSPVLVYPVEHLSPAAGTVQPLEELIGRRRADILGALEVGSTTTELSRRLRISPASASQHTAVLRKAGLISTRRLGNRMLHTLTPLGISILEAAAHRSRASDAVRGLVGCEEWSLSSRPDR